MQSRMKGYLERVTKLEAEAQMPQVSIERITPERAAALLETMAPNRRISDRHVAKLRRDMDNGRWFITSQGIGIDTNGQLFDGQHRLWAILQHGSPVDMVVVRGIDPAAMMATDENRKRTFPDDLRIRGEEDYTVSASMARLVLKVDTYYRRDISFATMAGLQFSRYELDDKLKEIKASNGAKPSVHAGAAWSREYKVPLSAAAACHYIASRDVSPEFADEFYERVADGYELSRGEPERALVEKFRAVKDQQPKERSEVYMRWILKAMKAKLKNKPMVRVDAGSRSSSELERL